MIPRFKPWLGWSEFVTLFRTNTNAVERFERKFANSFKAVDAVAFPYGRSAQWAFFNAVGISNAEIIMPAYTCSVVAHAVTLSGNIPCFIDICLDDYNMDIDLVEDAINENTRAIIATHTFGYPQNLDRLENIVSKAETKYGRKIWLMQDCCHAFGARWNGRMVGASGDVAVYAFNISKIMTSIFGGMLTFQNQELADRVRAWRDDHYKKASIWKAIKRRIYLLAVFIAFNKRVYGFTWWLQEKTQLLNRLTKSFHLDDKIHFPLDYQDHMLNVEAAIGLIQLQRYPEIISRRCAISKFYDKEIKRKKGSVFPPIRDGATYSHYVIRVEDRMGAVNAFANKEVHLGELIQYSIPNMSTYQQFGRKNDFPNALLCSKHLVNLPIYPSLPDKTRDAIRDCSAI